MAGDSTPGAARRPRNEKGRRPMDAGPVYRFTSCRLDYSEHFRTAASALAGIAPSVRSLSTKGARQAETPVLLFTDTRHRASAACRLAPPTRPTTSASNTGTPVSQRPSRVFAVPVFTFQPRSWYRAGVRSRRTLPSRSWLIEGSINAFGVWLMSKCENVEPVASTAGAYSRARPSLSVPAKRFATWVRATVAPGIAFLSEVPSASET